MKHAIFVGLIIGLVASTMTTTKVNVKNHVHYETMNTPSGTLHKYGELRDGKIVWSSRFGTDNNWYGDDDVDF